MNSTVRGSCEIAPQGSILSDRAEKPDDSRHDGGVFESGEGEINFRTVRWAHASAIFLKTIFATGVLAIPASMYTLGAVPGAINVLAWQILNTYCAVLLGNFRSQYPQCHSIADMADIVGGPILREVTGVLFLIVYVICTASGIIGVSVALNTLSSHALCTNWFVLVATIMIALPAAIRKFENIAWLTWIGFVSIFAAILIVVVGVTTLDRPEAAPTTGDYDLGFHVVGEPAFSPAIVAVTNIFCSSAANSAFLPVISEMKRPQDYNKAVFLCMGIVTCSYLAFSLVVYYWCGQWVASPSLGSAGPLLKRVSYGVGLLGLLISAGLYTHIGAKYLFVRILRNSKHLQSNSVTHWATWLFCVAGMCTVSFLIACGIPIFEFIIALAGCIGFAPLALILPGLFWLFSHPEYRQGRIVCRMLYCLHCLLVALGVFIMIGGTYAVVQQIIAAYGNGFVGSAFSCADNSNSS